MQVMNRVAEVENGHRDTRDRESKTNWEGRIA